MPGNDLSVTRALIPAAGDTQATSRANITTILTNMLNDIEPKVTPAGLDITSALSFLSGGVYSAATNVGYMHFQDRSATPAVNESLYVQSDELYFRDGNGTDIAMTSGGGIVGAPGNITGAGYGATGIEINWDTGTAEYRLKSAAGTHSLADVVLDKARFSDGSTYYATLGAQASMAATLAFSLPIAFPGSTSLMTMTSAGLMATTRAASVDSVTTSGDVTVGGSVKYTAQRQINVSASGMRATGTSAGELNHSGSGDYIIITSSEYVMIPVSLPDDGSTVDEFDVYVTQGAAGTVEAQMLYYDTVSQTVTTSGTAVTSTSTSFVALSKTALAFTPTSIQSAFIRVKTTASTVKVHMARIRHTNT